MLLTKLEVSIPRVFNPEMLLLARELRGFTQSDLADAAGVEQQTVSKYESGLYPPSDTALGRLADALAFPEGFFCLDEILLPLSNSHTHYRKRKKADPATVRRLTYLTNLIRIHIKLLMNSISAVPRKLPVIDPISHPAEDIAGMARTYLNIPPGPIVNLTERLETYGCFIVSLDCGTDDLDAFMTPDPKSPHIIFTNSRMSGDRLRFNEAHELGHTMMHPYPTPTEDEEANAFAGAFLMPLEEIQDDFQGRLTLDRLVFLKMKWKVSMQALAYRAKETGAISESQARHLFIQINKAGWKKREPVPIPPERPSHLENMIKILMRDQKLTLSDVARLLQTRVEDIPHWYGGIIDTPLPRSQQFKVIPSS